MVKLLIHDDSKRNCLDETSFGGLPVRAIRDVTDWPQCRSCNAAMQYLGKIKTDLGLELIFMCNNDDESCDEWDPEGGGNKAIIVSGTQLEFFKPEDSNSLREPEYGVNLIETDDADYETARGNWKGSRRDVLGQVFGEPSWIQGDETPDCECCSKPMRFVAQMEEGPDHRATMNFGGGGVAFLFDCQEGKTAKFLWQC